MRTFTSQELPGCLMSNTRPRRTTQVPRLQMQAGFVFKCMGLEDIPQSSWRSLFLESGSSNLYYDRSFIDAATRAWPKRQPTGVIAGYRGNRLVFLQPYRLTRHLWETTVHLTDIPTADQIEPIVSAEARPEIFPELCRFLIESLKPDRVNGRSLSRDFACRLAAGFGTSAVKPGESRQGWSLDLPESTDAFLKQYRSNFRSQLRRKIRKGKSAGLKFRVVTEAALPSGYDLRSAMDNLMRLHKLRFDSLKRTSFFLKPEFRSFHENLCQQTTNQSMTITFTEALHQGQVVGSIYGARTPHEYLFLMTGFDPRFAKYSPGSLLLFHTIQDLINRGVRRFDFKCGDEAYKRRWANNCYDSFDLEIILTNRGRALHLGRRTEGVIRSIRKQIAEKLSLAIDRFSAPPSSALPQLRVI